MRQNLENFYPSYAVIILKGYLDKHLQEIIKTAEIEGFLRLKLNLGQLLIFLVRRRRGGILLEEVNFYPSLEYGTQDFSTVSNDLLRDKQGCQGCSEFLGLYSVSNFSI